MAPQRRREEPRGARTPRTARGQLQSLLHAGPRQEAGQESGEKWFHPTVQNRRPVDSTGTEWTARGSSFCPLSPTFPSGPQVLGKVKTKVAQSCPTLCPWNSPGQSTGVGRLSLLQGIFPTRGSTSGLLHCRRIVHQLSHREAQYLGNTAPRQETDL